MVDSSRQMYAIGLLFGLGFDTATEVAVLGIAAIEGARGLPVYSIMIFPLLFTAGMSLIDTADGILMLGAYGWAFVKPARKLYYNMAITLVSVLASFFVGSLQALNVIGGRLGATGWFWHRIANVSGNFGAFGLLIVGLFAAVWGACALAYKLGRYDVGADAAEVQRIA
jgi:high-affinity nickel-transport protein